MASQVCIAIGVARCGNLTALPGAVNGAKDFAAWAGENGYAVRLFTDEGGGKVRAEQITSLIAEIVDTGDTERLIIYFAGHGSPGYASAECWLLSDAETDGTQAINLTLSLITAGTSQIRQLGIIADACRSRVANADEINGVSLFPRRRAIRSKAPHLDKFLACNLGGVAQEVSDEDSRKSYGIFSKCLMDALRGNVKEAAERIMEPEPAFAVTSGRLADYLEAVVPLESSRTRGASVQEPDTVSGWRSPKDIYRVLLKLPQAEVATREIFEMLPESLPHTRKWGWTNVQGTLPELLDLRRAAMDQEIAQEASRLYRKAYSQATAIEEGLAIHGMRPMRVASPGGCDITPADGAWRVRPRERRPQPVLVLLEDGRWLGTCIIADCFGEVEIGPPGVLSVLYRPLFDIPSSSAAAAGGVDTLTLYLMTALHMGRQPSPGRLERALLILREGRRAIPSLGIVAAHSLARLGRFEDIGALAAVFRAKGQAVPFDIALLAGAEFGGQDWDMAALLPGHGGADPSVAPVDGFFPLFTRTWGTLSAAGDGIAPEVRRAAAGIVPGSLWTLFDPARGQQLADYIEGAR